MINKEIADLKQRYQNEKIEQFKKELDRTTNH